ncbi:MOSC domain-containing protein [Nioella sp.]|uniref:MOSC domain-containing protein n=1 Tax=Nioella sp. TaxID=1912091 RepID=UPI003B519D00
METLASLTARFPRPGRIDWIGLRPARKAEMKAVPRIEILDHGLAGDHARPGKRAVTLIQAEHLPVIATLAEHPQVAPETLRRNLVVSGLNLSATRNRIIRIGTARLRITGPCAPCSRMERALGPGGYNAMRGHGGWCAEVLTPGPLAIGAMLKVEA